MIFFCKCGHFSMQLEQLVFCVMHLSVLGASLMNALLAWPVSFLRAIYLGRLGAELYFSHLQIKFLI